MCNPSRKPWVTFSCHLVAFSWAWVFGLLQHQHVFSPGLDTTQATDGAAEHWKNSLNSRCCKSGFRDPASPGLSPESIYTAIHTTVVETRVKTIGLKLWFPGSGSNQPCGEAGCLGRYHRLHLWLRISTCSHASEGVWGERSLALSARGPKHQGLTVATPLQIIREPPRKNFVSLGIFVASAARYGCKNSFSSDSGREVLAATAGRGRGKGVGWEALQGAASIVQHHAVPCRTTPYHAMSYCATLAVVRAGAWQRPGRELCADPAFCLV